MEETKQSGRTNAEGQAMQKAITAAVVAEREECAALAEHEIRAWERITIEAPAKEPSIETARVIAQAIRRRATGANESQEMHDA
jgi:hypothetical protein